jgi:RTX calcium-binding nonapeptide repeat (4 copies)
LFGDAGGDVLRGGAGNDRLFGGLGNDQLFGDGGNDILLGQGGIDSLSGGAGRDLLVGGIGGDTLNGESGDDILVAGSTAHDSNEAALAAILAEWASARTYGARVGNIRSGAGLAAGFALNGGTVTNDAQVDTLYGQLDRDWFLIGAGDKLKDKAAGELVN